MNAFLDLWWLLDIIGFVLFCIVVHVVDLYHREDHGTPPTDDYTGGPY